MPREPRRVLRAARRMLRAPQVSVNRVEVFCPDELPGSKGVLANLPEIFAPSRRCFVAGLHREGADRRASAEIGHDSLDHV